MRVTQQQAKAVMAAAIGKAREIGRKISVAIVDESGYLVSLERMDGAGFLTPQLAEAKAFTASAWGRKTSDIAERARSRPETYQAFAGVGRTRLIPGQGGFPIVVSGEVVGAVGISGGSADEDEKIGQAGVDAVAGK